MKKHRRIKERKIYDNYSLWEAFENEARKTLIESGNTNPSEDTIWKEIYAMDEIVWEDVKEDFQMFFDDNSTWILTGTVELWHGTYECGLLFHTFDEMIRKVGKDCDYFRFLDSNGHFFLQCSHPDGVNRYEIRKVTKTGEEYYENWEYGSKQHDHRSEQTIYDQIMKRYSVLPHFVHQVYGLPKTEYTY